MYVTTESTHRLRTLVSSLFCVTLPSYAVRRLLAIIYRVLLHRLVSLIFFFFQAEDGIRDAQESRGLGDVYKRQLDYWGIL